MAELVRDVGEEGAPWFEPLDPPERLLQVRVRGMRLVAQGVENQHVQSFEQGNRRVRDGAEIGDVGRLAETEAENRQVAVQDGKRRPATAKEIERPVDDVRIELGDPSVRIRLVENVLEDTPDVLHRRAVSVNGNRLALAKVEDANVIQTQQVIGVGVRKNDGVEPRHALAQRLLAEVGRRVDDHGSPVELEQHRRPGSLVVRVRRTANRAPAGNGGHTGRGSGAEESQCHWLLRAWRCSASTKVTRSSYRISSSIRVSSAVRLP